MLHILVSLNLVSLTVDLMERVKTARTINNIKSVTFLTIVDFIVCLFVFFGGGVMQHNILFWCNPEWVHNTFIVISSLIGDSNYYAKVDYVALNKWF